MTHALLYGRTLLNLRPVQVSDRVLRRFRSLRIADTPRPPLRELSRPAVKPIARPESMLAQDKFHFLNVTRDVPNAASWNDPHAQRLWLYNLHYFDGLNAEDIQIDAQTILIDRWIKENPIGNGVGWEPYPLSLRIVNWIKFQLLHSALDEKALASLAAQGRSLSRQIEYHLLGNHLLANAKALVFLGLFFDGREAALWLETGLSILKRELPEQILADGGHFERSPMYHAIVTEDVLDLVWIAGLAKGAALQVNAWRDLAACMLNASQILTHPDGRISFFNDAAFDVAPSFAELSDYAAALGVSVPPLHNGTVALPQTGYIRFQNRDAVLLFDAALPGPRYLLGHGHADTLSFELSLSGARLFVNAGTSEYAAGPQRQKERSTASHNTVVVDGRSSSEIWGEFRMARYARPLDVHWSDGHAEAAHNGYRRQFGGPLNRRAVELGENALTIRDTLEGGRWTRAEARFLLMPGTDVEVQNERGGMLTHAGRRLAWQAEGATARIEPAEFHPGFNVNVPAQCIVIQSRGPKFSFTLNW